MKTIEMTATIGPDRKLVVQLPPDCPRGEHQVVVVIEEKTRAEPDHSPLEFSAYPVGLISDTFTFRREDI